MAAEDVFVQAINSRCAAYVFQRGKHSPTQGLLPHLGFSADADSQRASVAHSSVYTLMVDLRLLVVMLLLASADPETGKASQPPGSPHASVTHQTHAFDQDFRLIPSLLPSLLQDLRHETLGLQFDI